MTDGGKGDKPRPFTDREQFDTNWDAIFKPNHVEPIPFAGLVDVDEELRRLRAENEELKYSGKNANNH